MSRFSGVPMMASAWWMGKPCGDQSSSGAEVSREDAAWGNGAFTEALLEALGSAADTDRDGLVGVSELMAHLGRRVPALTEGRQTPGIEARFEGGLFAAGL